MENLNQDFWENRYQNNNTGWDLGKVSQPLQGYFNQLTNKNLRILIPGAGNAYEAEYLFNNGFKNVYVNDIAKPALNNIKNRVPNFPNSNLIHQNFFELNESFDLIIEQTFFCAIHPNLRAQYAKQCYNLLRDNGKLVGVLFNAPMYTEHPPFGGNQTEYESYFSPYFKVKTMAPCYNSEANRKELFIILEKKPSYLFSE